MEIKQLKLKNFRCLKKSEIDFGKITLLTGPNNSGKSSIIASLLGALQTKDFPFYYSLNGKYVELGDFKEVIFNHDEDLDITLDFLINDRNKEYHFNTTWMKDSKNNMVKIKSLKIKCKYFTISLLKKQNYYQLYFYYRKEKDKDRHEFIKFNKIIEKAISELKAKPEKQKDLIYSDKTELKITNENNIFKNFSTTSNMNFHRSISEIEGLLRRIGFKTNFICSFRLNPERTYYLSTRKQLKIERTGRYYTDQIVNWHYQKANEFKEFKKIMKNLNLLNDIKVESLPGGRFEIRVKAHEYSPWSALNDIGFGVPQLLPVITADIQLGKQSTFIVAQPEIHLHPSCQADFGDYITNQIKKNEKKYIIETHSEYLLNRIRLQIVRGKISPDDVKIYYLKKSKKGNETIEIKFTEEGVIENAPPEFFDTYKIDVMDIAMEA
ncbi:MAG: AAA family ATPase [Atribacterota bacterium]